MIAKDSLQPEWIHQVSAENRKADKILIEKVIRALLLLEGLVESGLPFIFKGGTAVMLLRSILSDSPLTWTSSSRERRTLTRSSPNSSRRKASPDLRSNGGAPLHTSKNVITNSFTSLFIKQIFLKTTFCSIFCWRTLRTDALFQRILIRRLSSRPERLFRLAFPA